MIDLNMSYVIAFSGKGGTGKTTLAALTIRYLKSKGKTPILAVDADSNSCLNEALGVEVHTTIGALREESLQTVRSGMDRPGGMSTEELFDYQVQQSIVEAEGFDLIVMGRPEGPGCYCAANNIIRKYTDRLSEDYPYVVIDNEAGMEHLSRRTTHSVDLMFIVSDPTKKGLITAGRINSLIDELNLDVKRRILLVNRVEDSTREEVSSMIREMDLGTEGFFLLPLDDEIARLDLTGEPVFTISENTGLLRGFYKILDSLGI